MKRTTLFLPESLRQQLKELARRSRSSVSDCLRLAAEDLFAAAQNEGEDAVVSRLRERRFRYDRRFHWNRRLSAGQG